MVKNKTNELIELIKTDYTKYSKTLSEDDLVKVLKKLADVYYNTGESLLPDEIYDELRELLEELNPENPFLFEVGAPVKGTKEKVKLPFEMGSLRKIKPKTGALEKWCKKYEGPYLISDKLDGMSVQLYKNEKGKLMLYSRGKGTIGQDVSHLIKYLFDEKMLAKIPNNVSVRGELVISKNNFKKISSYMKNARSAAGGLINSKTVDAKVASVTEFVAYAILFPRLLQSEQMELLEELKFKTVKYKVVDEIDDDMMSKYLLERKKKCEYGMDGIVCIDNSKVYKETGGYPEYSFAFKMLLEDQIVIADVVDVIWNVSKDGYMKPTVQIKPVELMNSTVTYATAHNAKMVFDNNLGPGAKIKIIMGGDVIPFILGVVKESKNGKPKLPDVDCDWNETGVDLIVTDMENNEEINTKLLIFFFNTMGVKYMSEGIIQKLVGEGYDTVKKILKAKKDDLVKIDGIGEKLVKKIYDEIDRAFDEVELPVFMSASHKFGRGLGSRKLVEVINIYPNILNEKWSKSKTVEKILEVPGFAEKLAKAFAENFEEFKDFYKEISKIKDLSRFENIEESSEDESDEEKIFADHKIVFTGFRDANLQKFIQKNGGKVTTTVSKNTTILVHKDGADTQSSKFKKAEDVGTKIMSQSEFTKKYVN